MAWKPLDPVSGGRLPEGTPVDGVPDWLRDVVWAWFLRQLPSEEDFSCAEARDLALDDLALSLKQDLGPRSNTRRVARLQSKVWTDRRLFLQVLDWAVAQGAGAQELSQILEKAGSAWAVAPDQCGLSRRVLPEAHAAAAQVIEHGENESVLISQAWRLIYGSEPNPTAGFDKAVRAVESVACPVIIPNDKSATLGRAIGILKSRPPSKFSSVFRNPRETDPLDSVVALMQLVWTNNYARHAADPSIPLDVSQAEAEAALHAAVTLVQWFQRRYVGQEPL